VNNMDKKEKISERLAKNLPSKNKSDLSKIPVEKKDIKDDYEFSRETYKDLIRTGTLSMDAMAELARESEHPRAFEVLSNHIRNMGEVTDKLMKLQKAKKDLTQEENKRVTNNNVFVGSTTDLQRMLLNKDDNIIDVEPDKE
tara:strand:- start:1628 stop:2053 length:426 start_codon:yes stop_codon:yes gene_type:complete